LIEVVADPEMADKVVVVVAGGVEDADLEPRLAALGARCVRLGHVKNPATVYAAMDVLCLPSRREGFPNVVIEAAARGIPAIVSDATGCRDSVIDGQTGWIFSTNSVPDLKRRILAARSDGTRRAQFGRAARARAVADFDRPKVWAHIDSFLRGDERYTAASHHHVERRLG
jgi:glycosyltransferase involved in cell wall biosynthesis